MNIVKELVRQQNSLMNTEVSVSAWPPDVELVLVYTMTFTFVVLLLL